MNRNLTYIFENSNIGRKCRDEMIEMLAIEEFERCDDGTVVDILIEGCIGWENMDDNDIIIAYSETHDDNKIEMYIASKKIVEEKPVTEENNWKKDFSDLIPATAATCAHNKHKKIFDGLFGKSRGHE